MFTWAVVWELLQVLCLGAGPHEVCHHRPAKLEEPEPAPEPEPDPEEAAILAEFEVLPGTITV